MLDAGVLVGTLALVAFAWNLTRINDVMKAVSSGCLYDTRRANLQCDVMM